MIKEHLLMTFMGIAIIMLLVWRSSGMSMPMASAGNPATAPDGAMPVIDPMEGRTIFNYNQLPFSAFSEAWATLPLTAIPVTAGTVSYNMK